MADVFQRDETVIISLSIKNAAGNPVDPDTSITITIRRTSVVTPVVNDVAMTKDSVGEYHHDFLPTVTETLGVYEVSCETVDATRKSIQRTQFTLES